MRELVCNGQLWARVSLRQLRSHNVEQLDYLAANSLAKIQEMTAIIQYNLTSAQSFCSQDYHNKSLMMILGRAGVLFWENEQT